MFRFCSLLSLSYLFVISHGYSVSEYLTEESQRLDKYVIKLKEHLNNEVDPCESFLKYVNNSLAKDPSLPEQNYGITFDTIKETIYEAPMIRDYHLSCENRDNVNYFQAVKDLNIKDEIMSFPILDSDWEKYNYSLEMYEAKFMPYLSSLFIFGQAIKTRNGDYKFNIEPSFETFTLSDDLITNVLRHYEVNSEELIDQTLAEMKQFGSYYRHVLKSFKKVLDPFEEPKDMTLGELKEKYPKFNWDQYFSIISGGASFNDNAEVSVKYDEKIGYIYDFYPSKANKTVALYYLFQLHSSLKYDYNSGSCGFRTIMDLSDVVVNTVLHDYFNMHDIASLTDTVTAISKVKIPDVFTRSGIALETISELLSVRDYYSEYNAHVYGQITTYHDNYLSNYVKIKTAKMLTAVPEEYTTSFHIALRILTFAHLKPRLVLLAMWEILKCYDSNSQMETMMEFVDQLEKLDNEKYQNELTTLAKHNLTPRKLLFILLGQSYALDILTNETEFQEKIRAMKTFNSEFNCPTDSEFSYENKCKHSL